MKRKENMENRHAGAVVTSAFLISLFLSIYETDTLFTESSIYPLIESSHYLVAPVWSCPQPLQLHSLPGTGTSPHHQVWRGKISELRLIAQTVCDLHQIIGHESDIRSYKHRIWATDSRQWMIMNLFQGERTRAEILWSSPIKNNNCHHLLLWELPLAARWWMAWGNLEPHRAEESHDATPLVLPLPSAWFLVILG